MSTFDGFSEEDLKRIKSGAIVPDNDITSRKPKPAFPPAKKKLQQYKTSIKNNKLDDALDDLQFDKCRLSLKTVADDNFTNIENENINTNLEVNDIIETENMHVTENMDNNVQHSIVNLENGSSRNESEDVARQPYSEDDIEAHRAKLEELQLKQRLMEEQNKKRKEMLSKALADRTRQTEEEVQRLEKIKKELQVLDGQFSQDVGVLRKKIDLACLTYSEAEKHYLKVEKEFLQAKIQLQKEKEKKELLTEHLCALITHNETRKAQKLETLMLELAANKANTDPKNANTEYNKTNIETSNANIEPKVIEEKEEKPVIIDGVDQRNGKMVEFNVDS